MATQNITTETTISVVIPTVGRLELRRAVESALNQRVQTQVIVVLDDPSKESEVRELLNGLSVDLHITKGFQGGAVARNVGLHAATGKFLAYLDDDDWWEAEKITKQITAIEAAMHPDRTVSLTATRFLRSDGGTQVLPTNKWDGQQPVGDYLVCRPQLRFGTGFMQTSSIVGKREFLLKFPWDETLRKHQDWDLFVRIFGTGAGAMAFLEEELVSVPQASIGSVSKKADWRSSQTWFEKHHSSLSPKGSGDFLATQILRASLDQRDMDGLRYFAARIWKSRPHATALVVGFAGLLRK